MTSGRYGNYVPTFWGDGIVATVRNGVIFLAAEVGVALGLYYSTFSKKGDHVFVIVTVVLIVIATLGCITGGIVWIVSSVRKRRAFRDAVAQWNATHEYPVGYRPRHHESEA